MIEDAIANAGPRAREAFATMCEVAQRFAGWLGLRPNIEAALEFVFARWDGRGFPDVAGDAIPLPMRLLHVARDISLFLSAAGPDEARRSSSVDPAPRTSRGSPSSPCGTSTRSSPSWTRRACGIRRSRSSRPRRSGSGVSESTQPSWPSPRSPVSSRHGFANTRPASPLAEAAAWRWDSGGLRNALATRSTRARSRPHRRVERDLGEARTARLRRVGARPALPSFHGARVRPVTERSLRSGAWPARTTNGWTAPATTAARAGRDSIRPPASLPPPTATGPCARRDPTGRRSMGRRPRPS